MRCNDAETRGFVSPSGAKGDSAKSLTSFCTSPIINRKPLRSNSCANLPDSKNSPNRSFGKSTPSATGRNVFSLVIRSTASLMVSAGSTRSRASLSAPEMESGMSSKSSSASNCGWTSTTLLGLVGIAFEYMIKREKSGSLGWVVVGLGMSMSYV